MIDRNEDLNKLPAARLLSAEPIRQLIARLLTDAAVIRNYDKRNAEMLEQFVSVLISCFLEACQRNLYLDTTEAAEILNVSVQQVTYLCRKGKFVGGDGEPAAEMVGGIWRIHRHAVENYGRYACNLRRAS